MRESMCCHILTVIRFMINISAAPPVWLLVDFLQPLGIAIDQLERPTYWLMSTKLRL